MKTEEGYIEVPGGKVWYRAVGDGADAIPLLCLHGGPGFTHYYRMYAASTRGRPAWSAPSPKPATTSTTR